MPKPTLPNGTAFDLPPDIIREVSQELYDYLLMLHIRAFGPLGGTGDLDTDNINGALTDTVDHSAFTGVTKFQHHGATGHEGVKVAAASGDVAASGVSVAAVDAGTISSSDAGQVTSANATDLATVITLSNETKVDYNLAATTINEVKADYNAATILINEIKADIAALVVDLNAVQSGQNDLKVKLRTSGVLSP